MIRNNVRKEIYRKYEYGCYSSRDLAEEYGISHTAVQNIIKEERSDRKKPNNILNGYKGTLYINGEIGDSSAMTKSLYEQLQMFFKRYPECKEVRFHAEDFKDNWGL